jgi:tyrosine-protein kinase Etk/Wzc
MSQYTPQPHIPQPGRPMRPQQDDIDLAKYFFLFLENWWWFVIAVCLGLGIAFMINKYSVKEYKVKAMILIEDQNDNNKYGGGGMFGGADVMRGFGLYPSMTNLPNQTIILKSESQIDSTIHKLDFEVSYFKEEVFGKREVYQEAPFVVSFDRSRPQPVGVTFKVVFNKDSTIHISSEADNDEVKKYDFLTGQFVGDSENHSPDGDFRFGQAMQGENYLFTLLPGKTKLKKDTPVYYFSFNSYQGILAEWTDRLSTELLDEYSSMLELSVNTECPEKAASFLNNHLEMYLQRTLNKKNQLAINTVRFIDTQLLSISDSLRKTETTLQDFRSESKAVDISFQGQQLFEEMKKMEESRAILKLQGDYYKYLKDYLERNKETGDLVAPSVMGITDPLLNNLVLEINKLAGQKVAMTGGNGSVNPYMATINMQINNAKASAAENVNNLQKNNVLALDDIEKRYSRIREEVNSLPRAERALFSIERNFKLNDNIYTYLLQKRSEAQIAKASNEPDNEIINNARVVGGPIKPATKKNYIIGFLLGVFVPGVFFISKEVFNLKVETEEEVKKITNLPVAGHITHSTSDYQDVVLRDPQGRISEAFRNLRTRMRFFTREVENPVILISSSMPAEGKTFTALNLASAYSLAESTTVLVSFDLRKPRLYTEFGLDNEKGISTFLIGRDSVDDIVIQTSHKYLSIVPAGPVPPNPAELATSAKTRELFDELRKRFDIIIVDSAPIGAVSDTYSLAAIADAIIILVRHNKTFKQLLKDTMEDCRINGVTNLSILMNDIRSDMRMYGYKGRYGYTYGYGYDNNYISSMRNKGRN